MKYLSEEEAKQVECLLARDLFSELPVLRLECYIEELNVFDLQVDGDASFIADGFVVHNSEICRFMHGREFSVERARQRFDEVEQADDPEAVTNLQPWMRVGADSARNQVLYYERAGRRRMVARVDEPSVGASDRVGRYSSALSTDQLEAAGVTVPPLHGRCRSTIVI